MSADSQEFRTDSGIEVREVYTPSDLSGWDAERELGRPGRPPLHPGHPGRPCTAAGPGRSASTPASARPRPPTSAGSCSSPAVRPACRAPSTSPPRWDTTPTTRGRRARSARSEWRSTRWPTCGLLLDGIPVDKVSTSMTINSTAAILLLLYELVAEERGIPSTSLDGTIQNDILKEYVARGTYVYPPRQSMRLITDIFAYCRDRLPEWNTISISGYHIRRGGFDGGAGDRLHAGQRHRLRRGGGRGRAGGRRLRPPAVVLLERPQQPVRGGGQVPGRPADVGPDHDGPIRRHRREVQAAPLPHPDRREHADRSAA